LIAQGPFAKQEKNVSCRAVKDSKHWDLGAFIAAAKTLLFSTKLKKNNREAKKINVKRSGVKEKVQKYI
jgi:hypothetical protein